MSSAVINKFNETSTPSDEAKEFEEDTLLDSGTSMASNFRKMRLQGSSPPHTTAKQLTPVSPSGSVLARVQMFEAHNAKTADTSRSISYHDSSSINMGLKMKRPTPSKLLKKANSPSASKSNAASSDISVPLLERKQMGFQEMISAKEPASREPLYQPPPQKHLIHDGEDELMKAPQGSIESKENSSKLAKNARRQSPPATSGKIAGAEYALDKAIAESNTLSDRRRRMAMAKKHAAGGRNKDTTSPQQQPLLSSDPLDREALKLKKGKEGLSLSASPSRKKKFQMIEAKIKKKRERNAVVTAAGSIRTDSTSSTSSVNTVDFDAEPGAIRPRPQSDRQFDVEPLEALDNPGFLPTIRSSDSQLSYNTAPDSKLSYDTASIGRGSRSGSRSTSIADRSNANVNGSELRIDKNTGTSPIIFEQNVFQMSIDRKNSESPSVMNKGVSRKTRSIGFHHTDSAKEEFAPEPQYVTPQRQPSKTFVRPSPQGHYFAPIVVEGTPQLSSHDDGDDETQFNSVSMQDNHDRNKTRDSQKPSSPNSPSASKGSDASYFFSGGSRTAADDFQEKSFRSQVVGRQIDLRTHSVPGLLEQHRDDDAESYTDSVTNGSWTGRMRARKAMEQTNENLDDRVPGIDPRIMNMPSPVAPGQNHGSSMSMTDQVFNTFDKQQKAALNDAKEGLEDFTKDSDPNTTAIGLGVAGALCGAIVLGPIGIVLGAACSAGVGYKLSQMPEDERSEVKSKASKTIQQLHDSAIAANESISSTCVAVCSSSGGKEDDETINNVQAITRSSGPMYVPPSPGGVSRQASIAQLPEQRPLGTSLKVSSLHPKPQDIVPHLDQIKTNPSRSRQIRRITPACRRMGRITPVSSIHSLDPALHPRAWLDVMASEWTSRNEKNEAMEEILLLAKDKNHSRMLLEEGILDSLMYLLRAFFLNYAELQRQSGKTTIPVETYMADPNFFHAKLASNCCVALGKAHCAMVHTNGEEMIAATAHITVPITKQLAQMLYEVPHHMALKSNVDGEEKEIFKLTTEMSIQQAEDLASSIVSLSMGKVEVRLEEV